MSFTSEFLGETGRISALIDSGEIDRVISLLVSLRKTKGRLFFMGVGGGAGNASHAACDFRIIAKIEAYSISDNISELTARINDEGWDTAYVDWLISSRLSADDLLFVFSVGGGNQEKNVSVNLVRALEYAKEIGSKICGIVGRDGGYTAQVADTCVVIPPADPNTITPHTEAFQAVVWHLMVSHPDLQIGEMKWESIQNS